MSLPTMTIVGQSLTVNLEDVSAAVEPCPPVESSRVYTEKRMRDSASGAGKTVRVYRRFNQAEESISVGVRYVVPADYEKLRTMFQANPPTVAVTYLHHTSESFDLVGLTAEPDEFLWATDPAYKVQITLLRNSD